MRTASSAAVLLLACLALADARSLLHGHHHGQHHHEVKHRKHPHHHHHHHHHDEDGQCRTIAQLLQDIPSLKRFAAALDQAHIPYLQGLLNDPSAKTTFLAVRDQDLGTGDTVFSESRIRFLQSAITDRVKTCKAHDGDILKTLAGSKLRIVKEAQTSQKRPGRKLAQVSAATSLSTAWTSLFVSLPVLTASAQASNAAVSDASTSKAQLTSSDHRSSSDDDGEDEKHEHGQHNHRRHGAGEDEHEHHHKEHSGAHHKHHSNGQQQRTATELMQHALHKTARKEHKHGAVYLQSTGTSQLVKVLASIRACEGTLLIVSSFINAPPDPEPVILADSYQMMPVQSALRSAGHSKHGGGHRHHRHHTWLHQAKHSLERLAEEFEHVFTPHAGHAHHKHCKHARQAMRAAQSIGAYLRAQLPGQAQQPEIVSVPNPRAITVHAIA